MVGQQAPEAGRHTPLLGPPLGRQLLISGHVAKAVDPQHRLAEEEQLGVGARQPAVGGEPVAQIPLGVEGAGLEHHLSRGITSAIQVPISSIHPSISSAPPTGIAAPSPIPGSMSPPSGASTSDLQAVSRSAL